MTDRIVKQSLRRDGLTFPTTLMVVALTAACSGGSTTNDAGIGGKGGTGQAGGSAGSKGGSGLGGSAGGGQPGSAGAGLGGHTTGAGGDAGQAAGVGGADLVGTAGSGLGGAAAGGRGGNGNAGSPAAGAAGAAVGGAAVGGKGGSAAGGSAAGGAGGSTASVTACASLTNPLYVMSGDTQVPILKALGKALRQDTNPITLVWQATGSCTIIDAAYNGTPLKQNLSYIPADAAWDTTSGTVPTCTPDAAGAPVQLGIPIVFPDSCTTTPAPPTLKAFKGPVQSFVFVVPKGSTAQAISAEQAYLTFGLGANGGVTPWVDEAFYFVRPATKGTQVSLGAAIGVPAAKWKGQKLDQSTSVAQMVAASTALDKTIGILGTEIYDGSTNRAALRALSFQAFEQANGYFPDTTTVAFDKRSVRDGHYQAWSHVFYLATADNTGVATDTRARRVIELLTSATDAAAPAGLNPLALVAGKGLVPLCAMNVQRSIEGGALSPYQAAAPCGCFFEGAVGTAPTACVACNSTASCTTGTTCQYGFCEAADGRTSLADCGSAPATSEAIPNHPCTGPSSAAHIPLPQKQIDHGGTLPPLP